MRNFNPGSGRSCNRPITTDTLFNLASLRKVFEATLLAQAVRSGELGLDDPAVKYAVELQQGGEIRQITLGQLATHTSGLLLQDHPPWPDWGYTLPEFIRTLNAWTAAMLTASAISIPMRALFCWVRMPGR
jgi:beta-lactamase class C